MLARQEFWIVLGTRGRYTFAFFLCLRKPILLFHFQFYFIFLVTLLSVLSYLLSYCFYLFYSFLRQLFKLIYFISLL